MKLRKLLFGALLISLVQATSCDGDDDDSPATAAKSGKGGAAGKGGSAGKGGAAGESGAAGGGGDNAGGEAGGSAEKRGALIRVQAHSTVGVLLDELPTSIRERVATELLAKPESFFIERAKRQLALATYRLNFRAAFYEEEEDKRQLPLPPESVLTLTLVSDAGEKAVRRAKVEGHDYVLADYALTTVVVTDEASPGISEKALESIGGVWEEPFTFPVDPELLIQRTGYACMDEAEFPPNSVDSENPEFFYDSTCEVEDELSLDGCHGTELPDESCQDALSAHVGKVDTVLEFERLPWDESVAAAHRVGKVTAPGVADLAVVTEELAANRLIYRYIDEDSCALAEKCVGGTGWRRLLLFNASEKNVGSEPVVIGDVDYYIDDPSNPTPNANHHLYQYSACHNHYHFNYFATFTYGDDPDLGSKRAFCLESVARYSNHEESPTWSYFNGCDFQGITQGWGDQYNAGIECQWVDVTTVDTSNGPVTRPLGLRSNPEGFLCEGNPVFNDQGQISWESTELKTDAGETVDRPACDERDGWEDNNSGELDVTLPVPGEGLVTSPCTRGQIGPRRNCGFSYDGDVLTCTPGESVKLACSTDSDALPQAVRVCEASKVIGAGLACADNEALGSTTLVEGEGPSVSFTCPKKRSSNEPGGRYALYVGSIWPEDGTAKVSCSVQ